MTDETQALWRYEPAAEFRPPEASSIPARRSIKRLWESTREALGMAKEDDPLPSLGEPPGETLAGLAPSFDPVAAAAALSRALGIEEDGASRVDVVIGPPGAAARGVVSQVGSQRAWSKVSPPERRELAAGGPAVEACLEELAAKKDTPLVIEALEDWLARTSRGLPTMRRLLEALLARTAPTLVACDSWAWSFLRRTVGAQDLLGPPQALAALDGAALAEWLGQPLRAQSFQCRSAGDRESELIFAPLATTGPEKEAPQPPKPLVALAAAARGNPGLSLELWRRSLRLGSGEGDSGERPEGGSDRIVWSALAEQIEAPTGALEAVDRFVLHALLLHGGLDLESLLAMMPMSSHDVRRSVRRLGSAGLLRQADGAAAPTTHSTLTVALALYGAVRHDLAEQGFLLDDF